VSEDKYECVWDRDFTSNEVANRRVDSVVVVEDSSGEWAEEGEDRGNEYVRERDGNPSDHGVDRRWRRPNVRCPSGGLPSRSSLDLGARECEVIRCHVISCSSLCQLVF
jgi:hypothetical protein